MEEVVQKILKIAQDAFDDNLLEADTPFKMASGYDSMALVQFLIEIEDEFGVLVTAKDIAGTNNAKEAAVFVDGGRR